MEKLLNVKPFNGVGKMAGNSDLCQPRVSNIMS